MWKLWRPPAGKLKISKGPALTMQSAGRDATTEQAAAVCLGYFLFCWVCGVLTQLPPFLAWLFAGGFGALCYGRLRMLFVSRVVVLPDCLDVRSDSLVLGSSRLIPRDRIVAVLYRPERSGGRSTIPQGLYAVTPLGEELPLLERISSADARVAAARLVGEWPEVWIAPDGTEEPGVIAMQAELRRFRKSGPNSPQ